MSQLLIRRDPLYLVEREGTVEASRELPDFLRERPLTVHPFYFSYVHIAYLSTSNFFPRDGVNPFGVEIGLPAERLKRPVPALWSGYRSCLTKDEKTGELFRLKGVAFGPNPVWDKINRWVQGGQFLRNAHFEQIYSNGFNRLLREEGIEPVMEFVGLYKFPYRVQHQAIATSIMRVKGDTRLDELFRILEHLFHRVPYKQQYDPKIQSNAQDLYKKLGKTVGQLKRLMDKNRQTWSDNPERTNAHIGNVVVYETDAGNLALGLVDFDASCDLRDKTLSQLKAQQLAEYKTITRTAFYQKLGYRIIRILPEYLTSLTEFRQAFVDGFKTGYASRPRTITNTIPGWRFEELFTKILNPEQPETRLEDLVKHPEKELSYLQTTPSCKV